MVVSVSLIRNGYEYGTVKRSRGKFRIPSQIRSAMNQNPVHIMLFVAYYLLT